ncbi:MAG: Ig-like domain-containing protein, partial [Oscillospiraceae bacterium]|nr:Ig-like domain-containing protein [Oscillospiraceae bacterium]
NVHISVRLTNPVVLPTTVKAVFNDASVEDVAVTWENVDLVALSNSPVGIYRINGTAQGLPVICFVSMEEENYIENHSFEDEDRSMWIINNIGNTEQLRFQEKATDAHSGVYSLHFWDPDYVEFTIEQVVTGLRPGYYNFAVHLQGGDATNYEMFIFARADGVTYRTDTDVDGWVNWRKPMILDIRTETGEITVGVHIRANGGAWGTLDDFMLNPVE